MAKVCEICVRDDRKVLDREGLKVRAAGRRGIGLRAYAEKVGVSYWSLRGHLESHALGNAGRERKAAKHQAARARSTVSKLEVRKAQLVKSVRDLDLELELGEAIAYVKRILVAADTWLRDPRHPDVYNLDPRDLEIDVVYRAASGGERKVARLREVLQRVEAAEEIVPEPTCPECRARVPFERRPLFQVERVKHTVADPRKLLVEAADKLGAIVERGGKFTGAIKGDVRVELVTHPDWLAWRDRVLVALEPHPAALAAVVAAFRGEAEPIETRALKGAQEDGDE